jgi:hypothetical protein
VGYPNGQVDIPGLTKVGSNVTHSAEAFDKAHSSHAETLAPGSAYPGWATGASLAGAADAWSTFMKNLADQVRTFGENLTTTANEYQATDNAAADQVHQAGAGSHPGHPAGVGAYGQAPQ